MLFRFKLPTVVPIAALFSAEEPLVIIGIFTYGHIIERRLRRRGRGGGEKRNSGGVEGGGGGKWKLFFLFASIAPLAASLAYFPLLFSNFFFN